MKRIFEEPESILLKPSLSKDYNKCNELYLVYFIISPVKEVLYVGSTKGGLRYIRSRLRADSSYGYHKDLRDNEYVNQISAILVNPSELNIAEYNMYMKYGPKYNKNVPPCTTKII